MISSESLDRKYAQKMKNAIYPIIDGHALKCFDIRFKGIRAVCDMDVFRYCYNCTFIITPEQKRYLLKEFAEKYPGTFDMFMDYLDDHFLQF